MSRPFAAVESFLERILERPAARLFRAHPQPVHLERRIERAMTAHKMVRGGHTYVPSRYRIVLHPADLEALREATDQLPDDLADAILARARLRGYWLVTRPEVLLIGSARISQGELEVDAEPLDPGLVSSAAAGLRPVGLEGPRPPRPPIPGTGVVPDPSPDALPAMDATDPPDGAPPLGVPWIPLEATLPPADDQVSAAAAAVAVKRRETPAKRPEPPQPPAVVEPPTDVAEEPAGPPPLAVARPPLLPEPTSMPVAAATPAAEPAPGAVIVVQGPEGATRIMDIAGGTMRVGRGTDNEIVILDERVSRHHGRFSARHGVLVYTDLDSTNGSLVNGLRAREVALGIGDVVRLGRTTLTIRPRT